MLNQKGKIMEERDYDEEYRLAKELGEKFEAVNDDYLKFDLVANRRATRPDLHAMILLDELFPSDNECDIISAAEHDEIYFDIEIMDLVTLSDEHILELTRCGISYWPGTGSSEYDGLYSFV